MRYSTFAAGVLSSTVQAEQDLRAYFPINADAVPIDVETDPEDSSDPYIWFSFEEAIQFVYRVRRIRVQIALTWTGGPSPISTDENQWMAPNIAGAGDERSIVKSAFGLGLLGQSLENAGSPVSISVGLGAYKAADQTFRMRCLFGTDVTHGGVSTLTGDDFTNTAATLSIFGHSTFLTYPTIGTPPTVSGSVIITPYDYREYRDADGNNPIWDSATGARLIDPVPGGIG